jgi:hypothetical protein
VNTPAPNIPAVKSGALPQLVTNRRSTAMPVSATPRPVSIELDPSKPADNKYAVTLNKIRSVLPVSRLFGQGGDDRADPADFINAVVQRAAEGAYIPQMPGDIGRLADGSWFCRFPSTVSQSVVPLKLVVLHETWGISIEQPAPNRIVLRKTQNNARLWGAIPGSKKNGIEVTVRMPEGVGVGEITISGTLFGSPSGDFARQAPDFIPRLMAEVRSQLANVDDRRKHPRLAANFPITLYPIHSAGGIDVPIRGMCRDVSLGGICVATETPIPTKYAYGVFDDVEPTAGFAILIRFLRTTPAGRDCLLSGQFRVDL